VLPGLVNASSSRLEGASSRETERRGGGKGCPKGHSAY